MAEESRIREWLEVKPTLTKKFIAEKNRCIGDFGQVVDSASLTRFCRYALGIDEPVVSEYGIGMLISTSSAAYGRFARIHPPHPAFVNSNTLPLYLFGVSLKEFYHSGFLTFYKILFDDQSFIKNDVFIKNEFYFKLMYSLKNQGEWRYENKQQNSDRRFISLTSHFDEPDLDKLLEEIRQEFEKSGEIIRYLQNKFPPKKLFGLF